MTTALIWLLTPILILDCLLLGLLVIIQLPKKEAGVGMAFGGGATDALFGAGSGTALTKLTKYTAGIFFALVLVLSLLNVSAKNKAAADTMSRIQKTPATEPSAPPSPAAAPDTAPASPASSTAPGGDASPLGLQTLLPTNAPAAGGASNVPAK